MNQRPTKTNLDMCNIDRSMNEVDECIWAKRSTCLAADVVSFCFGPEAASTTKYTALKESLNEWNACRPASFNPVYYRDRDPAVGRHFPDIWLTLDACG